MNPKNPTSATKTTQVPARYWLAESLGVTSSQIAKFHRIKHLEIHLLYSMTSINDLTNKTVSEVSKCIRVYSPFLPCLRY